MIYGWIKMADLIPDGSAYIRGTYDKMSTHWNEELSLNHVDYIAILDKMEIPDEGKAAFYAYAINGIALESIANHQHVGVRVLNDRLKSIMNDLMSGM